MTGPRPRPAPPRWGLFVLGHLLALVLLDARESAPPPAAVRARSEPLAVLDPARMNLRELRRLPGIGQKLALAIDRLRDAHGARAGPLAWQDVQGIGPATEKKVLAWFRSRGIERRTLVEAPSLASEAGGETVHSPVDP